MNTTHPAHTVKGTCAHCDSKAVKVIHGQRLCSAHLEAVNDGRWIITLDD